MHVTKVHFILPFLSNKSFKVFYIAVNFCAIRLCHGKEQLEKIEVRDSNTPHRFVCLHGFFMSLALWLALGFKEAGVWIIHYTDYFDKLIPFKKHSPIIQSQPAQTLFYRHMRFSFLNFNFPLFRSDNKIWGESVGLYSGHKFLLHSGLLKHNSRYNVSPITTHTHTHAHTSCDLLRHLRARSATKCAHRWTRTLPYISGNCLSIGGAAGRADDEGTTRVRDATL